MLRNIGGPGVLLLFLVALLLFGPNKLPELGRAIGQTIREFKKSADMGMDEPSESKK